MRVSDSVLLMGLLVSGLAGCSDAGQSVDQASPVASVPAAVTQSAQAPYGVVADVRYQGNTAELDAGAKVYVFLREAGERMPLAVQYFDAAELPKQVSFTTPQPHSNVELVARLSFSGRVEASPNDPQVVLTLASVGHPPERVDLLLGTAADGAYAPMSTAAAKTVPPDASVGRPAVVVQARVSAEGVQGYPPDSAVFVVARQPGNPMPLAVKRLKLADLPAKVVLSDEDAMMFTHRLSTVDVFTLMARISRSGDAARAEGDPESELMTLETSAVPDEVVLHIIGSG